MSNIQNYCALMLQSADGIISASASRIAGEWNTGAALWDDGSHRYVMWGDTEGVLNIFNLETAEILNDVHKVVNNYESALTIVVNTQWRSSGDVKEVITFDACAYNTGATNKQLRPMGDRYVLEGAYDLKIFKSNAA
jgi:hypothetical protein